MASNRMDSKILKRPKCDQRRHEREMERGNLLYYSNYTIEMKEAASAAVFREITNTILPRSIKMVEYTPRNHPFGFLPILDTQMKVEKGKILFKHYKKPMASMEVIS